MAKKTLIIDDISGETGARTRTFSLDGTAYEVDLTDASFADLRSALKPFIKAGRPVGGGSRKPAAPRKAARKRGAAKAPTDAAIIRAWARANGMKVTERGRVAPELRVAWMAAGSPRVQFERSPTGHTAASSSGARGPSVLDSGPHADAPGDPVSYLSTSALSLRWERERP